MCRQVCWATLTVLATTSTRAATLTTRLNVSLLPADQVPYAERPAVASYEEFSADIAVGFARNCYQLPQRVPPPNEKSLELVENAWNMWKTDRMRDQESSGWNQIPPIPRIQRPPKVAFMMFASNGVLNDHLWLKWIQQAEADGLDFSFQIHSNGRMDEFKSRDLLQYVTRHTTSIQWCDMWHAQMRVMRKGLTDPAISHFIVVSRDSIPVKPLRFIYQRLREDPATRMCADDNWRGVGGTPRAESWWAMRREDAELFMFNAGLVRDTFAVDGCVDEQAWYYPLRMREDHWGREYAVRNECVMFADWANGPHACKDWMRTVDLCRGCDMLRSSSHVQANLAHPATYLEDVNASALQGLLDSPFWFARKFADGAVTLDTLRLFGGRG